jgi:hypothetical protein
MVAKGNKDGHRYGIPGGPKAVETQKWGVNKSDERYGRPRYLEGAPYPKDQTRPQDSQSRMAKVGVGDTGSDSWLVGGGKKGGEGYANFNPSRTSRNPATEGSGGRKKSPGFK